MFPRKSGKKRNPKFRNRQSHPSNLRSLSENWEGCCGEGFWLWARRRSSRIPAAGCKDRANAGHRQKTRRPEGYRARGRLASLLLSRRSTRDILLRRASPSSLWPENSTLPNFQKGSYLMALKFLATTVTPAVRAAQAKYYGHLRKIPLAPERDLLTTEELDFIAA